MRLYRSGVCKTHDALYSLDKRLRGQMSYVSKRRLKLFKVTQYSLKSVFKYLSKNARLLLSVAFGMSNSDKKLAALKAFSKEYLLKHDFDGAFVPAQREVYISRKNVIEQDYDMVNLFIEYMKRNRTLLRPHREFIHYLSGGMAVKLYLQKRGIKPVFTQDFDFKFAVPRSIRSQKGVDILSLKMKEIMTRFMNGFVRFFNKETRTHSKLDFREIEGVPLNSPSAQDGTKKVYKAYTYSVIIPGKEEPVQLVDTTLVSVPGIDRSHLSRKWSNVLGVPILNLSHMWRETMYILAGSFVLKTAEYRNPINGDKKEKGIKNARRAGHLAYLSKRYKGTKELVDLSRSLIHNVIVRNKQASIKNSQKIMSKLHVLQRLNSMALTSTRRYRRRPPPR